jgi:hypothetical protein
MSPSGKASLPSTTATDARENDREDDRARGEDDARPRDVFSLENSYEAFFVLVLVLFNLFRASSQRCTC